MKYRLESSKQFEGKTKLIFEFNDIEMAFILVEDILSFTKTFKKIDTSFWKKPTYKYVIKIYLKEEYTQTITFTDVEKYKFVIKTLNQLL